MHPLDIALSLLIATGAGSALVFIGVLMQWSLRKARPSSAPIETVETEPAPSQPAPESPEIDDRQLAKMATAGQIAEKPEPPIEAPEAPRAPVKIGLGLRKTRENFLTRIKAAITGSAKIDEIYEGLEEALIAADVGVETSMKITGAVRAKLGNDARADAIKDALKTEIASIMNAVDRPLTSAPEGSPLVIMMVGVNGAGKT